MTKHNQQTTHNDWILEGIELFGDVPRRLWEFVCPQCGDVSSGRVFMELFEAQGMSEDDANGKAARVVGRECVGRYTGERGCDWCAYGLFRGPREVLTDEGSVWCFEFAVPAS